MRLNGEKIRYFLAGASLGTMLGGAVAGVSGVLTTFAFFESEYVPEVVFIVSDVNGDGHRDGIIRYRTGNKQGMYGTVINIEGEPTPVYLSEAKYNERFGEADDGLAGRVIAETTDSPVGSFDWQ